mgnify:FL=1
MDLNKETIDRVAELAAALTPPSDIAALLGIPADMLKAELAEHLSPLRAAYLKAKAETALMLRRQEIDFARVGSPFAVQLTETYLREMTADEDY